MLIAEFPLICLSTGEMVAKSFIALCKQEYLLILGSFCCNNFLAGSFLCKQVNGFDAVCLMLSIYCICILNVWKIAGSLIYYLFHFAFL